MDIPLKSNSCREKFGTKDDFLQEWTLRKKKKPYGEKVEQANEVIWRKQPAVIQIISEEFFFGAKVD